VIFGRCSPEAMSKAFKAFDLVCEDRCDFELTDHLFQVGYAKVERLGSVRFSLKGEMKKKPEHRKGRM